MRKFSIRLNEWFMKDSDGTDIGHTVNDLTYEQKEGQQKTIKDLKNWIFEKGLEYNEDLCPCFLKIGKYLYYDNLKKMDKVQDCYYPDNTLLDSTEFNENNIMYVSFDKNRNCTCGKIHGAKAVSNVLTKKFEGQLEQEKKILQDNFNKKTEEIKKRMRII